MFQDLSSIPLQNGCPLPTSSSPVTMATVSKATVMTQEDAVKKALKMELDVSVSMVASAKDTVIVKDVCVHTYIWYWWVSARKT